MEFRFLTDEEAQTAGLYAQGLYIAVAIIDGRIVSMASYNTAFRGRLCDNCTQDCSTGGITWTDKEFRSLGIFKDLQKWGKEQLGLKKVYISTTGPEEVAIAIEKGLSIPKPGILPTALVEPKYVYNTRILNGIAALGMGG